VFVTVGSSAYTLEDFSAFVRTRPPAEADDYEGVFRYIRPFLQERALDYAAALLEDQDEEFVDLMTQYTEGALLFRISEDSVWSAAGGDSAAIRAHYEATADKYRFPERLRVIAFHSNADSTLETVSRALNNNRPVSEILAGFPESGQLRVDTTLVADSTGSIYDHAFGLRPGEHTEPLSYRRGYVLLRLDGIEAPRRKTFEEARAEVVGDYQDKLEEAWVSRLRARYNVRTFPERLEAAFRAAPPEQAATAREGPPDLLYHSSD
jgi:peptidyl-prolyl cis-trans isomerase SurA